MVKLAPEVHYQPYYDYHRVGWMYLAPVNNKTVETGPFATRKDAIASANRMRQGLEDATHNPNRRRRG